MTEVPPPTWQTQDWLIVVEALASNTHPEDDSPDAERRWQLIESISRACGIDPTEYVFEIDDNWGPEAAKKADDLPVPSVSEIIETGDWQEIVDALSTVADRDTVTPRTRRASHLAWSAETHALSADD